MEMAAASEARRRMEEMTRREIDRQRRYEEEMQPIIERSIAESEPDTSAQQVQEGEIRRKQAYEQAQKRRLQGMETPIERASTKESKEATIVKTRSENLQRAKLGGFSEWELQQAMKNLDVAQKLGTIGAFARDSSSVLPTEIQDASHAGDSLAGGGQLVGALGSLMSLYGAGASGNGGAGQTYKLGQNPVTFA
jgi:hypothetical protein